MFVTAILDGLGRSLDVGNHDDPILGYRYIGIEIDDIAKPGEGRQLIVETIFSAWRGHWTLAIVHLLLEFLLDLAKLLDCRTDVGTVNDVYLHAFADSR